MAPRLAGLMMRAFSALATLRRRLIPPEYAALEIGTASWVSSALAAFCELGLPQALAQRPMSADELAQAGFGSRAMLERLMQALRSYDIVRRDPSGRYELARVGRALPGEHGLGAMIRYANAPWHALAYAHLAQGLREARSGFECAHGEPLFAYLRRDAHAGTLFDDAMTAIAHLYGRALARAYDFSGVADVLDAGGGSGALLLEVKQRYPHLRCTVFETAEVVRRANGGAQQIEFVEGDLLRDVPPRAQVYLLSHVLHDWGDDSCERILRNVAQAMNPQSRLLIYELLAVSSGSWRPERVSDLEMLAILPGKERTRAEFEVLAARAGLCVRRVIATGAPEAVIECVRAESPGREAAPRRTARRVSTPASEE